VFLLCDRYAISRILEGVLEGSFVGEAMMIAALDGGGPDNVSLVAWRKIATT
jgi:hypothetical protein